MTLIKSWVRLCSDMALAKASHYSGDQKIIHGAVHTIQFKDFHGAKLENFGYSEKGNKIKALMRHYYDEGKTKSAGVIVRERAIDRKYGSAGFPLTGEVKKWTNQDFCMQSCTVTYVPDEGLKVIVFYRTTECIKKFGADLIFLRDVVFPRFERIRSIDQVTFMFSNLTVHPMFFPTLLAHHDEPVEFLKEIKAKDKKFHKGIVKWMTKYLFEADNSWVQKFSQARQTHKAMTRLMSVDTMKQLKGYFQ